MAEHHLDFFDPPDCPLFQAIVDGIKVVEGRKNSPQYQSIKPGDQLFIHDAKGTIRARVTEVRAYRDVAQYLKCETLRRALPCVKTYEQAKKIYHQNYVQPQKVKKLAEKYNGRGFLGIGIEVEDVIPAFTFALIRPNVIRSGRLGALISRIEQAGFRITNIGMRSLTEADVAELYPEHVGKPYYPKMLEWMVGNISGPSVGLILQRNAGNSESGPIGPVEQWKEMLGPPTPAPGTLRWDFKDSESRSNGIHGSDSPKNAWREMVWFFDKI